MTHVECQGKEAVVRTPGQSAVLARAAALVAALLVAAAPAQSARAQAPSDKALASPSAQPASPSPSPQASTGGEADASLGVPCPPTPAGTTDEGWFRAWTEAKRKLEEKTGTSASLCFIATNQVALAGNVRGGRNRGTAWWNLNLTQKLWPGAKLVTNTRGGLGQGIGSLMDTKNNLNWMGGEAADLYVSHFYVEQKLLDERLMIALAGR